MFKNIVEKLLAREFMILVTIEILICLTDVKLLLDTNNIILVTSLLGLTSVKKVIDRKSNTESIVVKQNKQNKKEE